MRNIKLKALGKAGSAHVLVPLLVIVGIGIVGSAMVVLSHADPAIRPYSGKNDGCGGNATHYNGRSHVGRQNYGSGSVCKCNTKKVVPYAQVSGPRNTPNPRCRTATNNNTTCPGSRGTDLQQAQMTQAGMHPNEFPCALYIFNHESKYFATRAEGNLGKACPRRAPSRIHQCSHANSDCGYGVCQSTPANKMAVSGKKWRTDIVVQIHWCNAYAFSRYHGWQQAYAYWKKNHHW